MLGGARIVRVVVLQESKMTASATVPPAPHKNFSRLPRIHRVSLECHTNGEYCQKAKIVTTHFFGFFLMVHQNFTDHFGTYALRRDIVLATCQITF